MIYVIDIVDHVSRAEFNDEVQESDDKFHNSSTNKSNRGFVRLVIYNIIIIITETIIYMSYTKLST